MGPLLHSPCNVRQCACWAGSCATREQSHVVGGCSAPPLLRCPRRPHRPRTVSAGRPRFSFRHTSKNHPKKPLSDAFPRNFQDAHVLRQFLNVWQHPQVAGPPWSAKITVLSECSSDKTTVRAKFYIYTRCTNSFGPHMAAKSIQSHYIYTDISFSAGREKFHPHSLDVLKLGYLDQQISAHLG